MKFIVCASLMPWEVERNLQGASPAAGNFLRHLKKAIENRGYEVEVCSYIAIKGAADEYKKNNISTENVIFKDKTIISSVHKYKKRVLETVENGDVILFYNIAYFDFGLAKCLRNKGAIPVLILADYTESQEENGSLIRKLISMRTRKEFTQFGYGIVLSEDSKQFFNKSAKTVVMEGGVALENYTNFPCPTKENITRVLYAGTFSNVTGIDTLLEAISGVKEDNMEFYFSGKGELEESIISASKNDSRIKYLGFMDENQYFDVLKKTHVFINPRNMTLPQNRNNFPSKVLEYLACGRPVISTKFPGYRKFEDNCLFCDNGVESLVKSIEVAGKFSETDYEKYYVCNSEKAKYFSWDKQIDKMLNLID